jgi:hypothetical protein
MALKTWEEMRKIDVVPFCKKRDGMLYLNWAKCIDLLRQNGAEEVYFVPIQNARTGTSLFESETAFSDKNGITNRCYETRIEIHIDGKVYYMQSPVMNGSNPVKDNSMSQQRVWNSMTRSFVKGVAIYTGLGFDLWLNEEDIVDPNMPSTLEKPASSPKIKTIQSLCAKHCIDGDAWVTSNNRTWETLTEKEATQMLLALKDRYGDD